MTKEHEQLRAAEDLLYYIHQHTRPTTQNFHYVQRHLFQLIQEYLATWEPPELPTDEAGESNAVVHAIALPRTSDRLKIYAYRIAAKEAIAALYGARQCLGNIANLSHAIELLEAANK